MSRRVLHVEVDTGDVESLPKSMDFSRNCWETKYSIISPPGGIKRSIRGSQLHTNFHSSMDSEQLTRVIDLDAEAVMHAMGKTRHVAPLIPLGLGLGLVGQMLPFWGMDMPMLFLWMEG